MLARSHPPRSGARGRLIPRPDLPRLQDLLIVLGALVIELTGYILSIGSDGTAYSTLVVVLHLLPAVPLLWHRRAPLVTLGVVLAGQAALTPYADYAYRLPFCVVVALFSVARLHEPRVTTGAAVMALAGLQLSGLNEDEKLAEAVFGDVVGVAMAVAAGFAVRQWERQLLAHRKLLAQNAVADERCRIARELHDIVAHHITAMQLMSGGARTVLRHDPAMAQEALRSLEDSGRLALSEMRQLLDVLRAADDTEADGPSPPQPGVDDLPRVVEESRAVGVVTDLRVDGVREELTPALGLTAFRIVQEALTNVRKHAGRAHATVRIGYAPALLTIEISDDGPGRGDTTDKAGPGHGLVGMRERVALHGGTLRAGPRPEGGFRVRATLPLPTAGPPAFTPAPAPRKREATR
ncbi:sensor histidine kinase [Streptomyces silvensis]|uniref:histidine kinase n=1 Tax=Streptomyces silvensis TaxID=1765722 RepID=A0A0W7WZQ9_9ACTN|nr:sensor histidine kinase [Streptomyces silvensis]KUF16077.1 hypothetical protein AT728_17060 [Streptomyces silvensis]